MQIICGRGVLNTIQVMVNPGDGLVCAGAVRFLIADQVSAKFLVCVLRNMQLPHDYDYDVDLRKTTARPDWQEQFMAVQHHACFNIAESIKKKIRETEDELGRLRDLR